MSEEQEQMTSEDVAAHLGISRRSVLRIPRDVLPYRLTPGGGIRQHRRYRRDDVQRYAQSLTQR